MGFILIGFFIFNGFLIIFVFVIGILVSIVSVVGILLIGRYKEVKIIK